MTGLEVLLLAIAITAIVFCGGWCIMWLIEHRPKKPTVSIAKPAIINKKDKRFGENQEFCPYCLTSDYFYRGGGSWAPDRCPYHPQSDDFIFWKHMSFLQRNKAAKRFQRMWKDMHGVEYTFTRYEDQS